MDKTYAETKGSTAFDWRKALIDAAMNGVTISRAEDLCEWAAGWPTCACGNQCAILQRNQDGQPEDDTLKYAGLDFYCAVENGNYEDAIRLLDIIEARAVVLVKEELAKLNSK